MRAILAHHMWRSHDSLPSPNGFERFGRMRRPLRQTPIRNRSGCVSHVFFFCSLQKRNKVICHHSSYSAAFFKHKQIPDALFNQNVL